MSVLDNPQFPLNPADQETLLSGQHECALIWSTRDGWPVGTMMTYLWRDGKIWRPVVASGHELPQSDATAVCALL